MLVLSRTRDEKLVVCTPAGEVWIEVVQIKGHKVRLGIEAPRDWPVHRQEVYEAIKRQAQSGD